MKRLCLMLFTFVVLVLFTANLKMEDVQGQSQAATAGLKTEIRSDVKVDNPGTITGTVNCRRVRHHGDVVVYIEKVGDNKYDAPAEHGIVDQMDLVFIPHVIAVQKGTIIDFPNNDQVRHNVFTPPDCCNQFNLGTYDIGDSKDVTFDKSCEVPLMCNVHAEMSAYVVVVDNPYFGVTAKNGSFTINNVPPGTYKLKTWHEKLKTVEQDVTVEGGKVVGVSFTLKKRK